MLMVQGTTPEATRHPPISTITFEQYDYQAKATNLDNAEVISIQAGDLLMKKVLLVPGSSVDVLFYSTFQKMKLSEKTMHPSSGELVGFSGERVHILGSIWMKVTLGDHPLSRTKDVQFLVVDCISPCHVILGIEKSGSNHTLRSKGSTTLLQ
ncbi:uncharacterized protein LOC130967120 [Arachis stenosperma]|uniref:uncharacterized protein LOC130967120 n=1 Tax=Arachis stenosperma TaxID=217475 RepID=UPI0025AC0FCC|nr:uncharacterized protein LOC130967120 [Arachis stenosperma]